ncbi:uncharacterized protein LOC126571916 [Anopheles aquasalis]|uniref:uncharacterized protein LOC126571916 n=1 Tax=Anopheles aquasalis TaxID=42839 RepID=UPI00215AECDE|nr:uncharacterized protein LOC126571916 [Anopheles aquasalis]
MGPSPERLFLSFLYYFNSILGINPYVFDRHEGLRFRTSTLKRYWSFAIGNLTGILVLFSFYIVLVNMLSTEPTLQYNRAMNICFVLVGAQISNLVLLLLLFVARCYGAINAQLETAIYQLVPFETDCSFWEKRRVLRQQICCDVSDRLDDLLVLHQSLTDLVHQVFQILQMPILLIALNQFVVIVSRSRRAGAILNAFINASIDRRTEQSIERFSLALMNTKSKLRVAGLFELDLEFLYSLATTTTSYLIVLIQFQLKD